MRQTLEVGKSASFWIWQHSSPQYYFKVIKWVRKRWQMGGEVEMIGGFVGLFLCAHECNWKAIWYVQDKEVEGWSQADEEREGVFMWCGTITLWIALWLLPRAMYLCLCHYVLTEKQEPIVTVVIQSNAHPIGDSTCSETENILV